MSPWVGRDEPDEQHYPPKETSQADDDSSLTAVQECRMCFEKQLSANDPILQLGCNCLGESSWAHESCIRKWFPKVCVHKGAIACEICMCEHDVFTSGIAGNLRTHITGNRNKFSCASGNFTTNN